jgi:hypothetical protein
VPLLREATGHLLLLLRRRGLCCRLLLRLLWLCGLPLHVVWPLLLLLLHRDGCRWRRWCSSVCCLLLSRQLRGHVSGCHECSVCSLTPPPRLQARLPAWALHVQNLLC